MIRRTPSHLLGGTLCLLLVLVMESPVAAQRRIPYSSRGRGPISPYVGLFRNDTGGINPYHAFVRPQQEYNRLVTQETYQFQQLTQAVEQNRQIILNPQLAGPPLAGLPGARLTVGTAANASQAIATAPHGSYFNYSHYYYYPTQFPQPQPIGVRRR